MECRAKRPQAGQRKKLIEAGYYYSLPAAGEDGLAEDAEFLDLPDSWFKRKPDVFVVHWECWPAVELFQRCATQWVIGPMGQRTGLNYASVIALAKALGCDDPDTFTGLQSLELGSLAAYAGQDINKLMEKINGA